MLKHSVSEKKQRIEMMIRFDAYRAENQLFSIQNMNRKFHFF